MEKTIDNIISILSDATHKEDLQDIDLDKNMKDQGINSLDAMSFFFSLEKAFDMKISIAERNKLHSLNDIINFLQSRG